MAPAAAIAVVLGEDLLREVLIRLPIPDDLLRAALACKPFLRAARNGPFLRRFRRLHPFSCPRLLGCLLLRPDRRRRKPPVLLTSPSSSSCSSSSAAAAAHGGDFALSFLPGGGWLGDAAWQLLDCRNGRVLLKHAGSQELAVADPMARRCISLPAPPAERAVGHGLVADDGDSSAFRVVCVSRDAASRELRALILSSGELSWSDVGGHACQPDLAGSRPMQANRSLYWRLEGGESMVAFSTATMEFSLLQLPLSLRRLSIDVVEKGEEEGNVLHLLTMSGFCIEVWAGMGDGDGGMAWRRVEKSVRFHKVVPHMFRPSVESFFYEEPSMESYQHELDVVGVAAGVVFVRQRDRLFSIDLETMKLRMLSNTGCSGALIYPYTIAWPPSFLNPA